jgi:uncharacterized membrane protein
VVSESSIKATLLAATLAILLFTPIVQAVPTTYEPKRLTATIYADGYVWIEYEVEANPLLPSINLALFGGRFEDLIVTSGDGLILDYNVTQNGLEVDTLGLADIKISYFTQDLTNKTGRLWTFTIDAPVDITVKLPKELTVVGLNKAPLSISSEGETLTIVFERGVLILNYIVTPTKPTTTQQSEVGWWGWLSYAVFAAGVVFVGGAVTWITLRRRRLAAKLYVKEKRVIDVEKILASKPDLRPDDKEVLRFLAEAGGEAFEAELRSRFNLPKTSMWRMVRRLQREGLVGVKKVGGQNLVYMRGESEIGGGTDVPQNP